MTFERDQERARETRAEIDRDLALPGRASRSARLDAAAGPTTSGIVMRKQRDDNGVAPDAESAVASAASSAGASLPATLQRKFESSLGVDLSGVRVHTGASSAAANTAVGARAYTVGQDIHFGAGQYDPSSTSGQHLLAHEVAHTVQQRGGATQRQHKLEVSSPGDALESEADRAADAMVAGASAKVSGGAPLLSRKEQAPAPLHAPPPPPGIVTLQNLQPVSAAVKAGEASGAGSIPSPAGLYDVAERNYKSHAQHCTNIQAHYAGRSGGYSVPLIGEVGGNHHFGSFANTAGQANKYCETGSVLASAASAAISMWIPLLQSSQSDWAEVKNAAASAGIETIAKDDGSTSLDDEGVTDQGEQLRGLNQLVSPKQVPDAAPDASPNEKADIARRKQSSDSDIAAGKNIKSESKVLLEEATTNFEQSMAEVSNARRAVVAGHGAARKALLSSRLNANQRRLSAAEEDKAKIDEILALVDRAQAAIQKGRSLSESFDDTSHNVDVPGTIGGINASQVATLVLQIDGTLPQIQGDIAACRSTDANLKDLIDQGAIASAGKTFTDALQRFRDALSLLPNRVKKYESAHRAYGESVNQALMKRGHLKPGEDGVKPMMDLLAKVRVAAASTSAAIAATSDVASSIAEMNALGGPPSPDVCKLANMVSAHARAFGTAPSHVSAILAVLQKRESSLADYVNKIGI